MPEDQNQEGESPQQNQPQAEPEQEPQTQETPLQEGPTPPKPEREPSSVDKEALKAELRSEVKKEVSEEVQGDIANKMQQLFGVSEPESDEPAPPWEQEGRRPKSYKELAEYSAELQQYRQKQEEAQQKQQEEKQKEAQQKRVQELNAFWDSQLSDLREQGDLPEVQDQNDQSDPGVQAEKAIFQAMFEENKKRRNQGRQEVLDIKDFLQLSDFDVNEHIESTDNQPAGANAPISGGRQSAPRGGSSEPVDYTYEEVQAQDYYDILMEQNK